MSLHCIHTIKKVFVILLCLFAGIFFSASATQPDTLSPLISYKHFGEEDGLKCKFVYEAIQDKNGFLWFSTDAGVFRYDGRIFKKYTTDDGLGDNEVIKICQDRYGRIWFFTVNGYLSFWKDGKIYNSKNTPFLKEAYTGGSALSHYEDTKGRLWIGTDRYGYIVIAGDSVSKIKSYFPYLSHYVYESSKGNMWVFGDGNMFEVLNDKFIDTILTPAPVNNFSGCHDKNNSDFFYWVSGKIYRIHDTNISLYSESPEISLFEKVINLVADSNYLWVCTPGRGCYELLNGKLSKRYFENTTVTFVLRDRENNLWFNTIGEGVYMLPADNSYVTNYTASGGLPSGNITSITESNKEIWLGFTNGKVSRTSGSSITTYTLIPSGKAIFNRVTSLISVEDEIFCGTDNGIFKITGNNIQPGFQSKSVSRLDVRGATKQLFTDSKKNIFAAHADGVSKFTRKANGYVTDTTMNFLTRTFAVNEYQNAILLATRTGLMEYVDGQEPVEFNTDIDDAKIRILDMKPDKDGLLLLAANGNGLYILKDKKLYQHLTTADGLSDNNCKRILIAGENVYVSTDNGINLLVKQNGRWNVSAVISTKSGLISDNINEVVLSNEKIYAASDKGLSVMDPGIAYRKQFEGKVYVTEVVTDSVKTFTEGSYSFKGDIPRLLIRFAYPVFSSHNIAKLRYRLLQGKNDSPEWITSVNNEVEFSSLSPGKYIFQVKPDLKSISEGGITSFAFEITPLWWQTTTARIISVLLFISAIVMIARRRIQQQYKKQLQQITLLEAERSRIASDMHDDIGADLTQISIWSNILNSGNKDANVVSRITKSSNEVLQKMEQIIWALNSVHNHTTDLISYLREYASQYLDSAGINLRFEAEETLPDLELSAIFKRNVFLTVKELLHNTVKHSGAKNVNIKIYHANSMLHVEYMDDGKGFTPKAKEDGLGNVTIHKRMNEINSAISIKTSPGEGFRAHLKIILTGKVKHEKNKL